MGSFIRTAYAWLLLSVIMLPLFPVAWLVHRATRRSDPLRGGFRRFLSSWVSSYALLTPLYRFDISGREKLPRSGAYVLVANHESGLDTLALLLLHTPARFLADAGLFEIPLGGWLFRAGRHIPVRRGDRSREQSGQRVVESMLAAIDEGSPIAVFPEGDLSPDGMAEFKLGAFVVAKRSGTPIYPVRINGTGRAWRPGTVVVTGRHEIGIHVLDPITSEQVAASSADELALLARKAIEAAASRGVHPC